MQVTSMEQVSQSNCLFFVVSRCLVLIHWKTVSQQESFSWKRALDTLQELHKKFEYLWDDKEHHHTNLQQINQSAESATARFCHCSRTKKQNKTVKPRHYRAEITNKFSHVCAHARCCKTAELKVLSASPTDYKAKHWLGKVMPVKLVRGVFYIHERHVDMCSVISSRCLHQPASCKS